MKKIIFSIAAMLSLFCISCNGGSSSLSAGNGKIKDIVREMKKLCPYQMGEWMRMDDVSYIDGVVAMSYTVGDGIIDFDAIKANDAAFRDNMLLGYATNSDEGFNMLVGAIIDADADLKVSFSDGKGNSHYILFKADELKSAINNNVSDPNLMLQSMADNARLQTPQIIDEGIVMTDVYLDENNLVYEYRCDESLYDIDQMNLIADELRQSTLSEIVDDPVISRIAQLLKQTNRKLMYKYIGQTSKKDFSIIISPNEIM